MPRSFVRCVLLAATTLTAGCPETVENLQLSFKVIQAPALSGEVCGDIVGSSVSLPENKYTLRLTFLQRPRDTSGGTSKEKPVTPASLRDYDAVCQREIPRSSDLDLVVPLGDRQPSDPISVVVEAFLDGKLHYVGRREDLNLAAGDGTIYLRQTMAAAAPSTSSSRGFSCMHKRGSRAFHSATLLPNGQVLFYGGLVAGSDATVISGETAYATGDVEVYDPAALKLLKPATKGTAPRQRGFHVAQLLPSPARGPYRILVVGGVMPPTADKPAFRLKNSTVLPFLINPHEKASAAPAAVLTYTPSPMSISYQELGNLQPHLMFPAATLADKASSLAVTGGAATATDLNVGSLQSPNRGFSGGMSALWFSLPNTVVPSDPNISSVVSTKSVRVGHDMARFGTSRYLVLGGNMTGAAGDIAELHTVGSGPFSLATIATSDPTPKSTVWHTLTTIGSSDQETLGDKPILPTAALWAGGFNMDEEVPNMRIAQGAPQSTAVRLVKDGGGNTINLATVPTISGGGNFTSTGYHHALRLHDGSVMLTGGNLESCSHGSQYCGSNQLVIYRLEAGLPTPVAGLPSLRVSRFGHRSTRMLDNTVLISGGITVVVKGTTPEPQVTNVNERFNPRLGLATEDYPLNRGPAPEDPAAIKVPVCKLRSEVLE